MNITKKIEALSQQQKEREEYVKIEQFHHKTFREKKKEKKLLEAKRFKDQKGDERVVHLAKKSDFSNEKVSIKVCFTV